VFGGGRVKPDQVGTKLHRWGMVIPWAQGICTRNVRWWIICPNLCVSYWMLASFTTVWYPITMQFNRSHCCDITVMAWGNMMYYGEEQRDEMRGGDWLES
jgi:hypothetical protein